MLERQKRSGFEGTLTPPTFMGWENGFRALLLLSGPQPLPIRNSTLPLPVRASRGEGEDHWLNHDCLIQWQWGNALGLRPHRIEP